MFGLFRPFIHVLRLKIYRYDYIISLKQGWTILEAENTSTFSHFSVQTMPMPKNNVTSEIYIQYETLVMLPLVFVCFRRYILPFLVNGM